MGNINYSYLPISPEIFFDSSDISGLFLMVSSQASLTTANMTLVQSVASNYDSKIENFEPKNLSDADLQST